MTGICLRVKCYRATYRTKCITYSGAEVSHICAEVSVPKCPDTSALYETHDTAPMCSWAYRCCLKYDNSVVNG